MTHPPAGVELANLGARLLARRELDEAELALRRAIRLLPDEAVVAYNLACVLQERGLDEAWEWYRRAVELAPGLAPAWNNMGNFAKERMDLETSMHCFDRAIALAPDAAHTRFNRALGLLLTGRFDEGWQEFEWRHAALGQPPAPEPAWTGGEPDGRTVLVEAEGGLGDAIHFLRYAADLGKRGHRLHLLLPASLMRLAQSLDGIAAISAKDGPRPPADCHAWLMSLPRLAGHGGMPPGGGVPYLRPPPEVAERWRRLLDGDARPRVALCWAGNPRFDNDRRRSLPYAALGPLLERRDVRFYSVQLGPRAAECAGAAVVDLADKLADLAETAAALAQMDLVISVDTAVAHLAGAVGAPGLLLLPFSPDWRWGIAGETTLLYDSLRLLRQARPGEWGPVVARAESFLPR